jgi:hypothetical protein
VGLALAPGVHTVPTQAQGQSPIQLTTPVLAIHPTTGALYLATPYGNLYLFDPSTLQLRARAIYTFPFESRESAASRARTFINPPVKSP